MIKNTFPFLIIFILTSFLFFDCANQKQPTGGPRDTIPPQLIYSDPPNKSLNFDGNEIELEFNEFIETDQLETNLIITPTVQSDFKSKYNKRTVTIEFEEDDPFSPNTTYTLNFQNAIEDINEGNPWDSAKFVFSTGDFLDSLSIKGNVTNLMTKKSVENAVVSLYFSDDTLNVFKDKPPYFTTTDKEGNFLLQNLKGDNYEIYAFKDENENLVLDPDKEPYGFIGDNINLTESIEDIQIKLYHLNVNPIILFNAQSIRNNYVISFNKLLAEYEINPEDTTLNLYHNFIENNEKIRIYNTFENPIDSFAIDLIVKDSISQQLDTLLYVKFEKVDLPPEDLTQSLNPPNNATVQPEFKGKLSFNKPIKEVYFDSLFFMYDSLNLQYITEDNLTFSEHQDEIKIDVLLDKSKLDQQEEAEKTILLYASEGSFISVKNDSSSTIKRRYTMLDPTQYGLIKGNIISDLSSFKIQLLNEKYEVVKEIADKENYIFNYVEPGEYMIRVLFDTNNNGEWDPGNIKQSILPEPVVFYKEPGTENRMISVKANWEIVDIDIEY